MGTERARPSVLSERQNWPNWAQGATDGKQGLAALEALVSTNQRLGLLGTPFIEDVEPIRPRISSHTGDDGEYVRESLSKITVDREPAHAVMRAVINRFGMAEYVANADARCWSGGLPYRGNVQTITTLDMVRQAMQDRRTRAVGVIALDRIDQELITPNEIDPSNLTDIIHSDAIMPELIVPVIGMRDLSPDMLVIDDETVTRKETPAIFNALLARGDRDFPGAVSIETERGPHGYTLRRLSELALYSPR